MSNDRPPAHGRLAAPLALALGVWSLSPSLQAATAPPSAPFVVPFSQPGYLSAGQSPDSVQLLGPPPSEGSGTKAGDVETYWRTRGLQGTPRWSLASRDAEFGPVPMMRDFSCALGVAVDQQDAPALLHLFSRLVSDSEVIELKAKNAYKRPRPFIENGGPICVAEDEQLKNSYSYPSGHSTFGWLAGLALAEIAPERAAEILSRARSYGESRVVCGVHYESDVQAGRITAAALFSAVQANADFQSDLAQARRDLDQLKSSTPPPPLDPRECQLEAQASANAVW